jgi:hypothetical protein
MRALPMALIATVMIVRCAGAAELPAVVQKPAVDVYAQPAFDALKVTTLSRDTPVTISAQQGLWYQLQMPTGAPGYVRVNDVRINQPGAPAERNAGLPGRRRKGCGLCERGGLAGDPGGLRR